MSQSVIELRDIKKSYGKHSVLSGVNMQVKKGDIYGLIGRNGAGKTTIFKIILGLSDHNSGELLINGKSGGSALAEGRKYIGFFVGSNFFAYMNARENLKYYCKLKGIKSKGEIDRVLKIVELDKTTAPFKNFSLGMKQRLGIANALLGQPEILILDEPTNGLDPQGIADVRQLIKKLNEEYGMTVIVSSHILGELQNTASRFGIVHDGVIAKEISMDELGGDEKTVRISVDDLEKATKALEEAGVKMLKVHEEAGSLETFYFNLVGGKDNA